MKYQNSQEQQSGSFSQQKDTKLTFQESMKSVLGKVIFVNPISQAIRYGSGLLVNENMVITSAHNIYDRQSNTYYSNFEFHIGSGESKQIISVLDHHFLDDYRTDKNEKKSKLFDFAVLQLEHSVSNATPLCSTLLELSKNFKYVQMSLLIQQKESIIIKDKEVKLELQRRIDQMRVDFDQQRQNNQKLQSQIHTLTETNLAYASEVQHLKEEVQTLSNTIQQQKLSINSMQLPQQKPLFPVNESTILNVNQSFSMNTQLEDTSFLSHLSPIKWNITSYIKQFYRIQDNIIGCCQTNNDHLYIIGDEPLAQKSETKFKLLKSSDNSSVCFGVMTERSKKQYEVNCRTFHQSLLRKLTLVHKIQPVDNDDSFDHISNIVKSKFNKNLIPETVQYWSSANSGKFKMNGDQILSNNRFYVKQNSVVTIGLDLPSMKLKFKNDKLKGTIRLNSTFLKKKLYPFVIISNKGDANSIIKMYKLID